MSPTFRQLRSLWRAKPIAAENETAHRQDTVSAIATGRLMRPPIGDPALIIALLAFPLALYLWRRSLNTPFFAVSGDDFHRALLGWEVTQGRWLPSDVWPPLQFWVEALVLQFYPHLLSAPALVNLCASTATLACLALLGRSLGLDQGFALVALALAASLPWFVWLSLSALAEPLFFFGVALGFLGVVRWRLGQEWGLWAAACGLLAAGMVRFDAWGYSVVFSPAVIWLWARSSRPQPHRWLVAAALPWIFPLFWLGNQYRLFGNPFYFSLITRNYFLATHPLLSLSERLLWQPRDLLALGGVVVPLGLIGAWMARRRPGVALLALMWVGSLGLLIQSTLSYTITNNNPPRLVVIHALLLTPFAALALQRLAPRGRMMMLAGTALALALIVSRIAAIPAYPNYLADDVRDVGSHIGDLRRLGLLRPGDHMLVEVRFWEYLLIQLLSDDPGAVLFDRAPRMVIRDRQRLLDDATNPSLLAAPPAALRDALRRQHVRIVVAYSDRAAKNLAPIAQETLRSGRFRVFVLKEQELP
jgi:hypothetical protein